MSERDSNIEELIKLDEDPSVYDSLKRNRKRLEKVEQTILNILLYFTLFGFYFLYFFCMTILTEKDFFVIHIKAFLSCCFTVALYRFMLSLYK